MNKDYIFKMFFPIIFILIITYSVFWITPKELESRVTISIVSLLALIAYNFVFEGDIPKLDYLTDLDKFILLSYVFCCIPTFSSIGFSRLIKKTDKLILPHPKCHLRNFVLFPILQITPDWFHPILKKNAQFLINQLSQKSRIEITRLKKNVNIEL